MDFWILEFLSSTIYAPQNCESQNNVQSFNDDAYRSDSSAADEASDNLDEADAKRSSERSRSSSNSWMRRFKAATSDSACKVRRVVKKRSNEANRTRRELQVDS
jgi:hypothetical protein